MLRKCPSCGSRFGVKSLGRKLIESERETEQVNTNPVALSITGGPGIISDGVYQVPLTVKRDEYSRDFECRKCGHRWSVKEEKTE
ncbi:MAG: hypothetical protein JRN08_03260 [Nitrososphaerota archaeon]|nr:hypothetical protein [Nitrososphaerota archaeon]